MSLLSLSYGDSFSISLSVFKALSGLYIKSIVPSSIEFTSLCMIPRHTLEFFDWCLAIKPITAPFNQIGPHFGFRSSFSKGGTNWLFLK